MPNPAKIRALCANDCGRRISKYNRFYCSNACQSSKRRQLVLAAFKAGTYIPRTWMHSAIRRYLLEKFGCKCLRCGWAERNVRTGRVPLEVEHIDGDWQNCTEENLTIICPNCHSLTPTFRNLNKGKGRPGRPGLNSPSIPRDVREKHKPISYLFA